MKLGPFIKCPYPEIIETCGIAGFDFVVIDMEHTPVERRELGILKLAADRRNIDMIVRIPRIAEEYFKWCLDQGITHIQVPFVQTKEDAQTAVKHAYFNPVGERGLCRFVRAADFSNKPVKEYLQESNTAVKLVFQIEGKKGIENIQEILSVGHIDTLFIGPYDLSQSLGVPGDIWNERVVSEMKKIIKLCAEKGVKVGTFTDTAEGVRFWSDAGVAMVQYGSDLNLLMDGIRSLQSKVTHAKHH